MDCGAGVQELAAEKRQAATGGTWPVVGTPPFPGLRGHPARSCLAHAERDNPVGVRTAMVQPGKPTVRKAQLPSGRRTAREANAGG